MGKLNYELGKLRDAGVEGVMGDVWWGVVEKDGPKQYNVRAHTSFYFLQTLENLCCAVSSCYWPVLLPLASESLSIMHICSGMGTYNWWKRASRRGWSLFQ